MHTNEEKEWNQKDIKLSKNHYKNIKLKILNKPNIQSLLNINYKKDEYEKNILLTKNNNNKELLLNNKRYTNKEYEIFHEEKHLNNIRFLIKICLQENNR